MKKLSFVILVMFCVLLQAASIGYPGKRRNRRVVRRQSPVVNVRPSIIIAPKREVIIEPATVVPVIVSQPAPESLAPAAPAVTHQGPEVGLSAGLFAGIPSAAADIWFHRFIGINGTGLKTGFRYAQGNDPNNIMRKNALIFADGTINLNSGPDAVFYLAGGLNYLAYTTGATSGTIGEELYLGVQEGTIYAEAGYSEIHTGFSPSTKGIILNMGLKSVF